MPIPSPGGYQRCLRCNCRDLALLLPPVVCLFRNVVAMLIGVYNGNNKITELRIITVSNLSTMLWCYDDQIIVQQGLDVYNEGTRHQWGTNSNVMKYYIFVLGLHIWSDQGVRIMIVALNAHPKSRRVSAVPSL
jgi:hypothetical protein